MMHGPINIILHVCIKFSAYLITATDLYKNNLNVHPYNIKIILLFAFICKPGVYKIKILNYTLQLKTTFSVLSSQQFLKVLRIG